MEAFRLAIEKGFLGIECDVRKTKDGQLVVCHDAFIDRTSDGHGLLSHYTYRELLRYNFGSSKTPSKIPLLKDVMREIKGIKLIELKTRIDLVEIEKYIDDNTIFISFDTSYMVELKKKYPSYRFAALNYVINSGNPYNLDAICLLDIIMTDKLKSYFLSKKKTIFIYGLGKSPRYKSDNIFYITDYIF